MPRLHAERDRWGLVEDGGPMPVVVASDSFGLDDWRRMAALAEALKMTEGAHPPMRELATMAERLASGVRRPPQPLRRNEHRGAAA